MKIGKKWPQKRIYLDFASLTPIDKRVQKEVEKYSTIEYTNPSALYYSGVKANDALKDAKKRVAKILHAHEDEIIFTSGGTESNQLVLQNDNNHIIISGIEHSSVIKNTNATHIPVDERGIIDIQSLKDALTTDTTLVSIMLVNNEVGTIEPIQQVAKIIRDFRKNNKSNFPLLHTDACQAGYLDLFVEKMGVDLLTLDSNKMYGPRGVGLLYVKRGSTTIEKSGTVNIPGIMGFVKAMEINEEVRNSEAQRINELKTFFLNSLQKINPEIKVNGDLDNSTPHILNVNIPNIDNEFFVLKLDARGIECSTKSACLRDEQDSYVLKAMGKNSASSVRFSFGRGTSISDIKSTLKIIENVLLK